MNLTKAIEVAKGVRDDEFIAGIQEDNASRTAFRKERTDALTALITLAQGVDAAKVDGRAVKVWAYWSKLTNNWYGSEYGKTGVNQELVVMLPAAAHDALVARCAALERQVTTMREALEPFVCIEVPHTPKGTPDEHIYLWKPSSNTREMNGIHIGHIKAARRALAQEGGEQHEH